ncbi:MAG: DUF1707 domain-containing protein [Nocardioides sp.]|uniref:DUF1707 SHOCT-like domain-containing protein n=1 Tax=Nocardioides sp. TaxID=35761 RepID=UPI003F087F0E
MSLEKRARDVDRQLGVDALQSALAQGQLTQAEYEERAGRVLVATTLGDVERELSDLQVEWGGHTGRHHEAGSSTVVVRGQYFSELPTFHKVLFVVVLTFIAAVFVFLAYMFVTDGPLSDSWNEGFGSEETGNVWEDETFSP